MKWNPDNQNEGGAPLVIQSYINSKRFKKSLIHEPRGLREGYAAFSHTAGTLLAIILLKAVSNAVDITTKPSTALHKFTKVDLTTASNLLNLSNSYYNTVFIDSSYLVGCYLATYSLSNS